MARRTAILCFICGLSTAGSPALAGMPAVLPLDIQRAVSMTDSAIERFQAISFFLLIILLCSVGLYVCWNSLRKSITTLPRLTLWRSMSLIAIWGCAMVVVLTMISGARELMTPGAWQRNGFTYRLANAPKDSADVAFEERMTRIDELRTALLRHAALHDGKYPSTLSELAGVTVDLPQFPGLKYRYVPNLPASQPGAVLAYEPDIEPSRRLVLLTDGEIRICTSADLSALLAAETKP